MPLSASRLQYQRRRDYQRAAARRRLRVESLEDRRLLAVLAADGFETGDFSGGSEQWASGNWDASGDATVRSDTSPATGNEHARLRRSSGDLQRTVDVSGFGDIELQFAAKLISFEGSDRADVKVSGDGSNWTTLRSFFNGDDDGQYKTYNLAVPDLGDTLHIRFDAGMSGGADYWFIDEVQVTGEPDGPPKISIGDAVAVEGDANSRFIDDFISSGSGGLFGPGDLILGPDGNLYLGSKGSGAVLRYDGETGQFLDTFVTPGLGGLENPQGLLFGPDGNLYVTSRATDQVLRFDATNGALIDAFVSAGSGGLDNPTEFTYGPDGNLFVSSRDTNEVLRYNGATGAFIDAFVSSGLGGLNSPHGLEFGPDGNLYVVSQGSDSVLRYDGSTGAFIDAFVPSGSGGLDGPVHLIFGPDSDLFVGSALDNSVLRYDNTSGAFLGPYVASGSGGLVNPIGLMFDANDDLYVSSLNENKVLRFGSSSQVVFEVSRTGDVSGVSTVDFATSDASAIAGSDYVTSSGTIVFDPGVTTRTIVVPTIDDTEVEATEDFSVTLSNPTGGAVLTADPVGTGQIIDDDSSREITISDGGAIEGARELVLIDQFVTDGSGGVSRTRMSTFGPDANGDGNDDLYVASADTNQILVYDGVSGAFIRPFADVLDPLDLQFNPVDGNLYVSSAAGFEVVRFDGQTGALIDTPITGLPDFPWGLTFTDDGTLYVAVAGDTDQVLKYDGTALTTFISSGTSGLNAPHKAVFGPDGHVYVNSNGNESNGNAKQVLRFDGTTGSFLGVVATLIQGSAAWVDFDSHGVLYVSGRVTSTCCATSISRVDPSTGTVIETYDLGRNGWSFMVGPDNIVYSSTNAIEGGSFIERIGPASVASFDVTLSTASGLPVTVDYTTSGDTATEGADYLATSGQLVFEPGVTSRTIIVPSIDDETAENTEFFNVTLNNPAGGVIAAPATVQGIIVDDDAVNLPPIVFAGDDQTLDDVDGNGTEEVFLAGLAIDQDGSIAFAEWTLGGNVIGNTPSLTTTLPVGVHTITLTATDNEGATGSDTVVVTINAAPTEVVLFEDSFEVGSNSNDWNGKWVEDSQNDYFRSTQRATDGVRSAEVDGWAYGATLTQAASLDLNGYLSSTLTFDWYIENGFDTGEYLSLDISTDGGSSWNYDVRRLSGNVDTENTWHSETVDLSPFASSDTKIRFRTYVSSSREDANIDNVQIVGLLATGGGAQSAPSLGRAAGGPAEDGLVEDRLVDRAPQLESVPRIDPLDVNGDGYTSPLDALMIINWLNKPEQSSPSTQLDTNGDGQVSPIDTLLIINELNEELLAEGESSIDHSWPDTRLVDGFFATMEEDEEESLRGGLLVHSLN